MALALRFVAHSEIGLVRKNNQDSGYASPRLLAVADGMGGAAAGDLASAVAVAELRRADETKPEGPAAESLGAAVRRANERIHELASDDPALDGMGTTVSALLFDGEGFDLAHIGDSRAYRLRDGALERLTHDHSWVQSLVDEGRISDAEAQVHPHRSLLLKVLNGQAANTPDLSRVDARQGDRLLLCSDGLCGLVSDEEITELLAKPKREQALAALTEAAHEAGGVDNITIVVADVVKGGAEGKPLVIGAAVDRKIPEIKPPAPQEDTQTLDEPIPAGPVTKPAVAVSPEEAEALRYAPTTGRRRWGALVGIVAGALVLVLALAAWGGWSYVRGQYFVGTAGDSVAIYQGVTETLFGLPLSEVVDRTGPLLADLPPFYQEQVRHTIVAKDLATARMTAAELRAKALACIAQRKARADATQPPGASPTETAPSGSTVPTPAPRSTATPVATATPTPSPSPAPTGPTAPDEC